MRRIGETEKCPACGWGLDPGAYRCPKCRIYFCYKCRVRVGERESQYQCSDQTCECYGKLLCSACVIMIENKKTETIPKEDATIVALAGGGAVALVTLFAAPFLVAAGIGVGAVVAGSYGLRKMGCNVWGTTDQTKENEIKDRHICCVSCRHPVKQLR